MPAGNRPSARHASPAGLPTHAEPGRRLTHSHLISEQQHYPQDLTRTMPAYNVQSHSTHRARDTDCNLDIETDMESFFLIFPASHIVLHSSGTLAVTYLPDKLLPFSQLFLALICYSLQSMFDVYILCILITIHSLKKIIFCL